MSQNSGHHSEGDIIAEVSEYRLSVLLNSSYAKSNLSYKARATMTQQKIPSFCGLP